MHQISPSNRVVSSLPAEDMAFMRPHLQTTDLIQGDVVFDTDDRIERVYFRNSGAISLVVGLASGQTIETAMIGRDSIAGGAAALNGRIAPNRALVQIDGTASTLAVEHLERLTEQSRLYRRCYPPRAADPHSGAAVRRLQRQPHSGITAVPLALALP